MSCYSITYGRSHQIIDTASNPSATGTTTASIGEHTTSAFVLNRQDCLANYFDEFVEASDRLVKAWQQALRQANQHHCLIQNNVLNNLILMIYIPITKFVSTPELHRYDSGAMEIGP